MKKLMTSIMALFIIVCAGCANISPDGSKESQKAEYGESVESITDDGGSAGEIETTDVNEEIMDRFFIDASLSIPGRRYKAYKTSLKDFEHDKLVAALMPDASMEGLQVEVFEGGDTAITFQEEKININSGSMRYVKDNEILYIAELFGYAENRGRLGSKELEFLTSKQAADKALALLSQLGLGTNFAEPVIQAFTKADLSDFQGYMMNHDEDFRYFQEIGKLKLKDDFRDDIYRITYTFTQDGLPVLSHKDPAMAATGGIDAPIPAHPMEATVYISAAGIRYIELSGVVNDNMVPSEETEIILLDGIKKALIRKYGDVILTEDSKITDIWLEYIPFMDASAYGPIELIPAWCCEFYVDSPHKGEGHSRPRHAVRFHAFTGEEIS